jgi:hypothetical protein
MRPSAASTSSGPASAQRFTITSTPSSALAPRATASAICAFFTPAEW